MEAKNSTSNYWTVKRCSSLLTLRSGSVVYMNAYLFVVTVVVVLSLSMSRACADGLPVGDDPTADRPVEGLLHSGHRFPKTFYWQQVRTSPGSFRYTYVGFVVCCVEACIFMPFTSGKLREYFGNMCGLLLASVVVYSHNTVSTLSELITAFFIGLCTTQVQIDIVRQVTLTLNRARILSPELNCSRAPTFLEVISGFLSFSVPLTALVIFPFSAVLSLSYQDSYHPMEILTLAYSAGSFQIIAVVVIICAFNRKPTPNPRGPTSRPTLPIVVNPRVNLEYITPPHELLEKRNRSQRAAWSFRFGASMASMAHMFFVVWAFLIAKRVEGVHHDVLYMFLITTIINMFIISAKETGLITPQGWGCLHAWV